MSQAPGDADGPDVILVALGANAMSQAGSPRETLHAVIAELPAHGLPVVAASRLYSSPAFPPGAGPDFVNAVVRIASEAPPESLLQTLHRLESRFGRTRDIRWGPRTLDLDLLACGGLIRPDAATLRHWIDLPAGRQTTETPDRLLLPHPRLQDRGFVLVPLMDVAPGWRHPLTGLTVARMLAALPQAGRAEVRRLD